MKVKLDDDFSENFISNVLIVAVHDAITSYSSGQLVAGALNGNLVAVVY